MKKRMALDTKYTWKLPQVVASLPISSLAWPLLTLTNDMASKKPFWVEPEFLDQLVIGLDPFHQTEQKVDQEMEVYFHCCQQLGHQKLLITLCQKEQVEVVEHVENYWT